MTKFKQGIFWDNFPIKESTKLEFLNEQVQKTSLRNKKEPYLIYTGTTNIDLSSIKENQKLVKRLRQSLLHVYLYEPVSLYCGKGVGTDYYLEFHHSQNNLVSSTELDDLKDFTLSTGIKLIVHTCDYNPKRLLQHRYPELEIVCDDFYLRIATNILPRKFAKKIKKPFWCTNGRYTPHKHLITSYLANYPGNYSWHFTCSDIEKIFEEISWLEKTEVPIDKIIAGNKILNDTYHWIDAKSVRREVTSLEHFYLPTIELMNNPDFLKSYDSCFCAIVNETRFAQPMANISEKVMDAISTKTPFILGAPPYSLEYMHKLGFKTFSAWWDESYDQEENHSKRLAMICKVIDYIGSKNKTELKEMYDGMEDVIIHNYNRAKKFGRNKKQLPS